MGTPGEVASPFTTLLLVVVVVGLVGLDPAKGRDSISDFPNNDEGMNRFRPPNTARRFTGGGFSIVGGVLDCGKLESEKAELVVVLPVC